MVSRIALALASAALLLSGSLQAQQGRSFGHGMSSVPTSHFGAAYHPVGPMRQGSPAATGGMTFTPAPRRFAAGSYQNPNQFRNFRGSFPSNSFHNGSFRNCY